MCVRVLCVCACCIGHTIIRLFLRKLAKRANICASFSPPSSLTSLFYPGVAQCQRRLCIFHNIHVHVLNTLAPPYSPTLLRSLLSTRISEFVSMSGASCVVQNMRIRCRLPCIHQHVMRRQQLPLSTCHLPLLNLSSTPLLDASACLSVGASAASANKNVKYLRTVDIPAQSGSSGGVWQMPR